MAFVKGSVIGDLKTFASPFSDEIGALEFGISSLDNIPASVSNEFSVLMSSISNCTSKVISYTEVTNNGLLKANITLHRQGDNFNRNEVAHLDILQTNKVWRIVNSAEVCYNTRHEKRLRGQFGDNVRMKVVYGGDESQKRTGFDVCSWRIADNLLL